MASDWCPKGQPGGGFVDEKGRARPSRPLPKTSAQKRSLLRAQGLRARRRQGNQGRRRALRHLPQREVRGARTYSAEQSAAADGSTPPAQRRPAIRCRRSDHPPRIHPRAHVSGAVFTQREQRQGQGDRGRCVIPVRHDPLRHHQHNRTAGPAPVSPQRQLYRLGGAQGLLRPAQLPKAQAVPPKPQPAAHRPTRCRADRTLPGPRLVDRRGPRKPALDRPRTLNDIASASGPILLSQSRIRSPTRRMLRTSSASSFPPR